LNFLDLQGARRDPRVAGGEAFQAQLCRRRVSYHGLQKRNRP
jgi:hypothetical protein